MRAGAHTTVWTQADDPRVVAFHAIAPTQFVRDELPSRGLAGGYSAVPGYLIARLALHVDLHGQGLGSQLLLDALERITDAAALAGGRLIAVDAIDEHAHRFYRHHEPPRADYVLAPRPERQPRKGSLGQATATLLPRWDPELRRFRSRCDTLPGSLKRTTGVLREGCVVTGSPEPEDHLVESSWARIEAHLAADVSDDSP